MGWRAGAGMIASFFKNRWSFLEVVLVLLYVEIDFECVVSAGVHVVVDADAIGFR